MEFSVYQCLKCDGLMQSKYSGHFSQCKCGESFVDQTSYYIRVGGHAVPLEREKDVHDKPQFETE